LSSCTLPCQGAVNLRDPSAIEEFYSRNINVGKQIAIVFHCEFSSSRAPKLFKHMRNLDRLAHMETYPELAFPNMFLLKGGYKAFFELYSVSHLQILCTNLTP
jgi:hypothetical protein